MRITKYYKPAISAIILLAFFSCKPSATRQDDLEKKDSVDYTSLFLPDTAYASADAVSYRIEEADSTAHPLLNLDDYYSDEGVYTFRKTQRRDASFAGKIEGTPSDIEVVWTFNTEEDFRSTWHDTKWGGGSGWTGQPLYLKGTNEIVVGSLCSRIYFIDFNTGDSTRTSFPTHNPIKGTVSYDAEYNNLYAGQGVPNEQPFGCLVFDLDRNEQTFMRSADPRAIRGWGAYDSSPVIAGGYLFWPGENGGVYKYRREKGKLTEVSVLRYTVGGASPGIETSLCVYRNYGYFGDNHGNIICINLNTMKPVWHYNNHDDTDASLVCQEEDGTPYIYTGCEVDKQGETGESHFVKLNGLNGELVWERTYTCGRFHHGNSISDGGLYGTPLLGTGDSEGMIFCALSRNGADGHDEASGQFFAFDTKTGEERYMVQLDRYAWSSPVSFLNEHNEMFILLGDCGGKMYVIRAKTGEILVKKQIGFNFESSPLVIGNTAVVGSRTNGIHKVALK